MANPTPEELARRTERARNAAIELTEIQVDPTTRRVYLVGSKKGEIHLAHPVVLALNFTQLPQVVSMMIQGVVVPTAGDEIL